MLPSIKRLHIMTTILLRKRNWLIYDLISHNQHLGISPPQKQHPLFTNPPLKSVSCPSRLFLKKSPYLSFFYELTPKIRFFSEPP